MAQTDPAFQRFMRFLHDRRDLRQRLPAPHGRTVVYSGRIGHADDAPAAWQHLARLKQSDPATHDFVTLEERLRQFHVTEFGESLYDHARRVSRSLNLMSRPREALTIWRALSGIYVQGASGRVRALITSTPGAARRVFGLTEVHVLLQPRVLSRIEIDVDSLLTFRLQALAGGDTTPIEIL